MVFSLPQTKTNIHFRPCKRKINFEHRLIKTHRKDLFGICGQMPGCHPMAPVWQSQLCFVDVHLAWNSACFGHKHSLSSGKNLTVWVVCISHGSKSLRAILDAVFVYLGVVLWRSLITCPLLNNVECSTNLDPPVP